MIGSITSDGDDDGCSLFVDGKCISCPSGCSLRSTGTPGSSDFKCECSCDDGTKSCITSDASGPVAEQAQQKLEESKEKLEESKQKLEESKEKLEESKQKIEESKNEIEKSKEELTGRKMM